MKTGVGVWHRRRSQRLPRGAFSLQLRRHHVDQLDAVELGPDVAEPVPDIAAQHERIVGGLAVGRLVGDERDIGHRCDFDLLAGHLVELRDGDVVGVLDLVEVGVVGRRVPLEERGVVDEVLHQDVVGVVHEARGLVDLAERGDRGAENMEHREGELGLLRGVEKADVAQRAQRGREQAGADVDHRHLGARQRVEDLHLVGGGVHVHHLGDLGVEPLQRALGAFGVEGAGRDVVGDEIVEQRPRHGRLADAALVRAHQNHCRLCHTHPRARIGAVSRQR